MNLECFIKGHDWFVVSRGRHTYQKGRRETYEFEGNSLKCKRKGCNAESFEFKKGGVKCSKVTT